MRELSSPRVDQSARCPVRELAIRELAYPRVVQLPLPIYAYRFLWPPCVADADIIFLPCGFFYLSFFFISFSSPNLSGRRLDVYHTSTRLGPSANLECRSEMCCTRLAGNTGRINDAKNRHLVVFSSFPYFSICLVPCGRLRWHFNTR